MSRFYRWYAWRVTSFGLSFSLFRYLIPLSTLIYWTGGAKLHEHGIDLIFFIINRFLFKACRYAISIYQHVCGYKLLFCILMSKNIILSSIGYFTMWKNTQTIADDIISYDVVEDSNHLSLITCSHPGVPWWTDSSGEFLWRYEQVGSAHAHSQHIVTYGPVAGQKLGLFTITYQIYLKL